MTAKITNTLNQPLTMFYRLPLVQGSTKTRLLEIDLPSRALLHDVVFADEQAFEAFKEQNSAMIESQKIIIGKTNEKTAEKVSNDNAANTKKFIQKKKDQVVGSFESVASNANTNMKIKVEGAN